MTRSNAREIALHLIYAQQCSGQSADEVLRSRLDEGYYACLSQESEVYAEQPSPKQRAYITDVVKGVSEKQEELSGYVAEFSIGWSVRRISRLARAIMELAMYEALYVPDVPFNAAIHEAVVLARKYEEDETASFVNGVLGSFSRKYAEGDRS
ncbi:MAG: transcription antitermination factor NusB [Firmicutes bacterium]|nr:transcription antitermination factor NusB [Bacillota bacterium]MDY2719508.1 transcription antitermination factor NusB [Candidatus Faecousia sp.]